MRSNYKQLGNYIAPIDLRNRKLEISNLIGLSIQKKFIPSISNIIGTDMSTYRIINQNQFAYCPVTSRNGEKITIALYQEPDTAIISQAYEIFEITRSDELIPEYLMMWFRRPEFDRYARFVSHGSVREMFGWEEMCNVMMPIPHPDKQKEIVNEYNTIVNRINLNNQLIKKLEETAQTIYKQWFVDFEFPDKNGNPYKSSGGPMKFSEELEKEIPIEWNVGQLGDFINVINGYAFESNDFKESGDIVISMTGSHMNQMSSAVGKVGRYNYLLTSLLNQRIGKLKPKENITCKEYVYYFISKEETHKELLLGATGSANQANISPSQIKSLKIVIPENTVLRKFEIYTSSINDKIILNEHLGICLNSTKDLLLSKLATIEN